MQRKLVGPRLSLSWVAFAFAFLGGPSEVLIQGQEKGKETPAPADKPSTAADSKKGEWIPLLKGSDLKGWTKTNFGGEGEVKLVDGELTLGFGSPLTGITYEGKDFPKDNYEMRWEAKRVAGQDFLAGVTFPIGDEFCSFIAGGWGGGLVGISNIDGYDASENNTTGYEDFKNNVWYSFRVRVTPERLEAWINDRQVVDVEREDHQFSVRIEVSSNEPLGYCNFECEAVVRGWEYRLLNAAKKAAPPPAKEPELSSKEEVPPSFLRLVKGKDDVVESLQTAVAEYMIEKGPFAGAKIDLIGAVHVGEKQYYAALNKRFKEYESLLFELVADPGIRLEEMRKDRGVYNPLSAMQVGMKDALELTFQLDEINYEKKNFVHADMTPEEFMADMESRKDGFLSMFARVLGSSLAAQSPESAASTDAKMLAAMMSKNRALALRRVFAEQFQNMDLQLMGLQDQHGKSTLLTERNRKAMEVLNRELEQGKRRIGIFYGAAHLEDMDRRLLDDFQAARGTVHWLEAWSMREPEDKGKGNAPKAKRAAKSKA